MQNTFISLCLNIVVILLRTGSAARGAEVLSHSDHLATKPYLRHLVIPPHSLPSSLQTLTELSLST